MIVWKVPTKHHIGSRNLIDDHMPMFWPVEIWQPQQSLLGQKENLPTITRVF